MFTSHPSHGGKAGGVAAFGLKTRALRSQIGLLKQHEDSAELGFLQILETAGAGGQPAGLCCSFSTRFAATAPAATRF